MKAQLTRDTLKYMGAIKDLDVKPKDLTDLASGLVDLIKKLDPMTDFWLKLNQEAGMTPEVNQYLMGNNSYLRVFGNIASDIDKLIQDYGEMISVVNQAADDLKGSK